MAAASPAKAALAFIKKRGAKIVDLKFIDMPGMWQHTSLPTSEIDEKAFLYGDHLPSIARLAVIGKDHLDVECG